MKFFLFVNGKPSISLMLITFLQEIMFVISFKVVLNNFPQLDFDGLFINTIHRLMLQLRYNKNCLFGY